jgi:diguanylate cyclase (GGDEF)-like protein
MSRRDNAIILAVVLAAFALLCASWGTAPVLADSGLACAVLTLLATVAQLYEAKAPDNQIYYPHNAFFFAGVLLLPPPLLLPLIVLPHVGELIFALVRRGKLPFPPAVQIFNIAMHLVVALTAWWIARVLSTELHGPLRTLLPPTFAAFSYMTLNHLIVGLVLVLINGLSWRESGVLEVEALISDLVLSIHGFVIAVLWRVEPWLILPALAPLVLMARALLVPKLQQEARIDGKTALLNARYLQLALDDEFQRATRSGRPLSVVMADLDYLRTVNNSYGHLAGDAVLVTVGRIIGSSLREGDHGGRFGGEEFTLVLPNTTGDQAYALAEQIRAAIEDAQISVPGRVEPIRATMSFGIAERTPGMATITDLTGAADVAVYEAKSRGRNRVELATPLLLSEARAHLAEASSVPRGSIGV